jgi:hypothetical protein
MGVGSRGYGDSVWALGRGGGGAGEQARRRSGRWPPRLPFPGEERLGGKRDGPARLCRCKGRWRRVLFGLQLARDRSSPRPGARLPVGSAVGRRGGLRVGVKGSGAFIGAGRSS